MLVDVSSVRYVGDRRLVVRFEDGVEGEVNFDKHVDFTGVFESLRDPAAFAQVRVNPDTGTIEWPNGADFDPVVLHCIVTGKPVPAYQPVITSV